MDVIRRQQIATTVFEGAQRNPRQCVLLFFERVFAFASFTVFVYSSTLDPFHCQLATDKNKRGEKATARKLVALLWAILSAQMTLTCCKSASLKGKKKKEEMVLNKLE